MANVTNVITVDALKKQLGVKMLDLHTSKAGNTYTVVEGEAIMLAPGIDTKKPLFCITMLDKATGETWRFISDSSPKPLDVVGQI